MTGLVIDNCKQRIKILQKNFAHFRKAQGDAANSRSGGSAAGHNTDGFDVSANDLTIQNRFVHCNDRFYPWPYPLLVAKFIIKWVSRLLISIHWLNNTKDDCLAINKGTNIVFKSNSCTGGHGISIVSRMTLETLLEFHSNLNLKYLGIYWFWCHCIWSHYFWKHYHQQVGNSIFLHNFLTNFSCKTVTKPLESKPRLHRLVAQSLMSHILFVIHRRFSSRRIDSLIDD